MTEHELIADYRARLTRAAQAMPADERDEVLADFDAHLREIGEMHGGDEAGLREALDRLGRPEDAVGATTDSAAGARDQRWYAVSAMLLGLFGGMGTLVVVGLPLWVGGLIMLGLARSITSRERVVGFVLLGSGPIVFYAVLLIGLLAGATTCAESYGDQDVCDLTSPSGAYWVPFVLLISMLLAQIGYVIVMVNRLHGRRPIQPEAVE